METATLQILAETELSERLFLNTKVESVQLIGSDSPAQAECFQVAGEISFIFWS